MATGTITKNRGNEAAAGYRINALTLAGFGYISSNATQLIMFFPVGLYAESNLVADLTNVTRCDGYIRGINGYVEGTNVSTNYLSIVTDVRLMSAGRTLRISMTKSGGLSNAVNNTPVVAELVVTVTF